jgi:ergothioneine biosynthesis protein EgtB
LFAGNDLPPGESCIDIFREAAQAACGGARAGMHMTAATMQRPAMQASLAERYAEVRRQTESLAAPLSAEDCCVQSMPDASPTKWHLAHTTWFFETFVLAQSVPGHRPWDAGYSQLFNSYYEAVGPRHPRPERGLLTRPSLPEVHAYREAVDGAMRALLSTEIDASVHAVVELGLHHEQQHQELVLTDIKHLLSCNPLLPRYAAGEPASAPASPQRWLDFDGGLAWIGHDGAGFAFDNEGPRHRVFLEPFLLAHRPVTCGEYLDFIVDGGYRTASLWLAEAWDRVKSQQLQAPLYWRQHDGAWFEFTLHGLRPVDVNRPVCHLSYFEADAFARYADARLPTEFEWEAAFAMRGDPSPGSGAVSLHPRLSAGDTQRLVAGGVWEWTSSGYAPYPGFRIADSAIGEYNGKFMVNQYVLRGASCATPPGHARITYRNFFPAAARWQFSGMRLARDA